MSDWKISLVYADDKSNKFWRGRTEGSTMYVNFGRVGTDGQTQVKEFGSAGEADQALDKQAASKRKKGYADAGDAASAPAEPAAASGPRSVSMSREVGGRTVTVVLSVDGATLRTEVTETHASDADAAAAFDRIERAMAAEGYRAS